MPKTTVTQKPKIPDDEAAICERMRSRRVDLGIPQKELAKRMGVPLDTLRSYEYARAPIRYGFTDRFCSELDVNQRWLFLGSSPKQPYIPISPIWAQFIPNEALFSEVMGRLLCDLFDDALEHFASEHEKSGSSEYTAQWRQFPFVSEIGSSRTGLRNKTLEGMQYAATCTVNITPQELWESLQKEHNKFLEDFERRHRKVIDGFLARMRANPTAEFFEDENTARSLIASRLNLEPAALKRVSMLAHDRRPGMANQRR